MAGRARRSNGSGVLACEPRDDARSPAGSSDLRSTRVGKSTVSAILATRLHRAAHIEADELHRMIVIGGEWPSAGTGESYRQLLLRTRNATQLAVNFIDAGFTPIIDEVIGTADQLSIVEDVLEGDIDFVVLSASEPTVLARDAERQKHVAANYPGVAALVAEVLVDLATFIETSGLSAESTADAIQLALPEHEWTKADPPVT